MIVMGKDVSGNYFVITTNTLTVKETEISDLSSDGNKNVLAARMRADREKKKLRADAANGNLSQKDYLAKIKEIDDNLPEIEVRKIYDLFADGGQIVASFNNKDDLVLAMKNITQANGGFDISDYQAR